MGNCCIPVCDQDQLCISVDKRESIIESPKQKNNSIDFSEKKLFNAQNSENLPNSSYNIIVSNINSTEITKFENTGPFSFQPNLASSAYCRCGTAYIYQVDLINIFYSKHSTWNIPCSGCQKIFSSSGWFCPNCSSVVCNFCSDILRVQCPSIKCSSGHELEYCEDTILYLLEKFNTRAYECQKCFKFKMESSFCCRTCNYNICLNCSQTFGFFIKNPVGCYGRHSLMYENLNKEKSLEVQCSHCFKSGIKDRMYCDECEYSACFYCIVQMCCKKQIHPGVTCREKHVLVLESMKKVKKDKQKWLICLRCSSVNMMYVYGCKECQECLCLNCGREVLRTICEFNAKPCARGHIYLWNPEGAVFETCFFCQVKLEFSGFYCQICAHAVCVECIQYSNSFSSRYSSLSSSLHKFNN